MRTLLLALCTLGLVREGAAQGGEPRPAPDSAGYHNRLTVLPFISYSPETRLLFGVGGGWQFKWPGAARDRGTRASYLAGGVTYTTRNQWAIGAETSLFLPDNRWWLFVRSQGAFFPLVYYGVGPETRRADSNRMEHRLLKVEAKALRRVSRELYLGPYYRLHSFFDVDWQFPARIGSRTPGSYGGVSSGLGVSVQLDSRNSVTTPARGHLVIVDLLRNTGLLGSQFDYTYLLIDARAYLPVRHGRDVLAVNLYGEFNGQQVPIQTMAMISNGTTQELVRGVYLGRFRDRHELVAQADYRGHLKGRLGYVLFGSAGNVFGTGGSLGDDPKFTYGAGLRFNVNPRDPLNLRMDYTLTSFGESGLSLGAAEAF
jgi:hypothetical protein